MTEEHTHTVSAVLTAEHLRLLVENHLQKPEELADEPRLAALVQSLVDKKLGYPLETWHQWDDWTMGLESLCRIGDSVGIEKPKSRC